MRADLSVLNCTVCSAGLAQHLIKLSVALGLLRDSFLDSNRSHRNRPPFPLHEFQTRLLRCRFRLEPPLRRLIAVNLFRQFSFHLSALNDFDGTVVYPFFCHIRNHDFTTGAIYETQIPVP